MASDRQRPRGRRALVAALAAAGLLLFQPGAIRETSGPSGATALTAPIQGSPLAERNTGFVPRAGSPIELTPNERYTGGNQTLTFDVLDGTTWVPLNTTGTPPPARMLGGAWNPNTPPIVYDPANFSYLVIAEWPAFGNWPSVVWANGVWQLSGWHWTNLTGNSTRFPPPFGGQELTYDGALGGVLLFESAPPGWPRTVLPGLVSQTWLFRHDAWQNLTANLSIQPPGRYDASFFYDNAFGAALLMGGQPAVGQLQNDTWAFEGTTGWVNLTASLSLPTPLANHGNAAYDAGLGYALAIGFENPPWSPQGAGFGGTQILLPNGSVEIPPPPLPLEWKLGANGWENITGELSPWPPWFSYLVDDPAVSGLLMVEEQTWPWTIDHGVCCPGDCGPRASGTTEAVEMQAPPFDDFWTFTNGSWTDLTPTNAQPDHSVFIPGVCPVDEGVADVLVLISSAVFAVFATAVMTMRYRRRHGVDGLGP